MGYAHFFALVLRPVGSRGQARREIITQNQHRGRRDRRGHGRQPEPGSQSVWDFAVVLSSREHEPCRDDLVKSAVLVDPRGRKYKALIWEGAPGNGTHRAGVLKFIAIKPRPEWIELRIQRPGEARPRTFGWLLGGGLVAQR